MACTINKSENYINNEATKTSKQQTTVPSGYTGIYTADDLATVSSNLAGDYILMANIDMTGQTYTSIGLSSSAAFTGTFDGNYYTISNLTISSSNTNVGMFGYLNGGVIQNLTLNNINVTGTLAGTTYIGGLVGYGYYIQTNYSYTTGKIDVSTTSTEIGGLVGTLSVETATSSYWAPEAVGTDISAIGSRRRLQEMLYQTNYPDWDFSSIWSIEANGQSLPYLKNLVKPTLVDESNYEYSTYEGVGTETNPYIIDTAEKLQKIKETSGEVYYKIVNNIDLSSIDNFEPIGTAVTPFMGKLDGGGYKISNLNVESAQAYVGLFGYINSGTVQNLTIENVDIKGTITGIAYIGGLAGYAKSTTINNVDILGDNVLREPDTVTTMYVGGLVGYSDTNTISYCTTEGFIDITNATTTGNYGYIGGILGYATVTPISECNSSMDIEYSVSKQGYIGGIAGQNSGQIVKTYSVGEINATSSTATIKGIAGSNSGTITSSYYNIANATEETDNGESKTLSEMMKQETYTDWNFDVIWKIEENVDTPVFSGEISYYEDGFWEWHTRTTTSDLAYNGTHIVIDDADESVSFYGYGITSYKDFLYKDYEYVGQKIFEFAIDETAASYHTLDGAGFIFNANTVDGLLSGYILLIQEDQICVYRLDNVDVETFEITASKTVASYAGDPIVTVTKTVSDVHNLRIVTSPTNVTVEDNGVEIINQDLDYSTHVGEDFGLFASYLEHYCSILTEIVFEEFQVTVIDYVVSITKRDNHENLVSGAQFQVLDSSGNVVREGASDSEGIFDIVGLAAGEYILKEVSVPEGYVLDTKEYQFTMNPDGTSTFVDDINYTIYNPIVTADVPITKYKENSEEPVPGAVIGLYNSSGSEVLDANGNQIKITIGEDGKATFEGIEVGTYKYKELEAPEGYFVNEIMYTFTVNKDGTVTYGDNNGIIYNEIVKADVTITKYRTGSTTPVPGATIVLIDDDGNILKDVDGNDRKLITNEEGKVEFIDVEMGTYKYRELEAPEGYELNEEVYEFTVNSDGTVTYGENNGIIYNDRVKAEHVIIIKYKTGTEIPVSGAVIGLFDSEGNPILGENGEQIKLTTNEDGKIDFTNIEVGTYKYKELEAPAGWVLNDTMYTVVVDEEGNVTYENNGIIYNEKEQVYGNVVIRKYEEGTSTPVPGAIIGLYDKDGNPLLGADGEQVKLTTDISGKISFKVSPGTYKYKELEAPSGYILNNTMYEFTVSEDGTVSFGNGTGIIYNNKKQVEPEPDEPGPDEPEEPVVNDIVFDNISPGVLPQTGTGENFIIIALIISISAAGIYFGIKIKKK